jgi:hypothetical protein
MIARTSRMVMTRMASIYRRLRALAAHQSRLLKYNAAIRGRAANTSSIVKRLRRTYQPVTQPLVLVSQAERSGGSMLAQLFDSHTELLAHPQELKIGYPDKGTWPPIKSNGTVDETFRMLFEYDTIRMCEEGYVKGKYSVNRKNFFFLPQAQKEIFRAMLSEKSGPTQRDILNAYFSSYFNAWINMQGDIEAAKFVTGFTPRLTLHAENFDRFWNAYPDGYLVSVMRSPLSWFASFERQKAGNPLFDTADKIADYWNRSAEGTLREKQRNPERVIVISFDDLVTRTEATMRLIARRIGIVYEDTLVVPTFNGKPIEANTSFAPMTPGSVSSAPAEREAFLSAEDRNYINNTCMPLYDRTMRELIEAV